MKYGMTLWVHSGLFSLCQEICFNTAWGKGMKQLAKKQAIRLPYSGHSISIRQESQGQHMSKEVCPQRRNLIGSSGQGEKVSLSGTMKTGLGLFEWLCLADKYNNHDTRVSAFGGCNAQKAGMSICFSL